MDRMTFLKQLSDRGYSRDEATQALQTWRSSGKTFDDDPTTNNAPEQQSTNWVPGGVGGVASRAIQGAGNVVKGVGQYVTGLGGQTYPAPGSIESTALDVGKTMGNAVMQPQTIPQTGMGMVKGLGATLGNIPGIIGNAVGVVSPAAGQAINNVITPGQSNYVYQPTPEQQQGFQTGSELTNAGLMALPAKIPGAQLPIVGKAIQGANIVLGAPGAAIESAVRLPDMLAGKLASGLSGVPEETLRAATNPVERAKMAAQSGQEAAIGEQFVKSLQDAYNQIPRAQEIQGALQNLPPININSMTDKMLQKASGYKTPELQAVGDKLVNQADALSKLADPDGNIDPSQLWDYRKQLDQTLYGPKTGELGTGEYISQLKGLRDDIRQSLLDASDNTPYADLMKDASNKLNTIDDIKKMIGGSDYKQAVNSESFIKNILNGNKTTQQKFLQNYQDVFETPDFLEAANYAKMARQIGEAKGGGGELALLPKYSTGKATLGPMLDMLTSGHIGGMTALSSPAASTMVTLPATQYLGKLGTPLAKSFQGSIVNQQNPYMTLGQIGQQQ
jgi:hypothetical protein